MGTVDKIQLLESHAYGTKAGKKPDKFDVKNRMFSVKDHDSMEKTKSEWKRSGNFKRKSG